VEASVERTRRSSLAASLGSILQSSRAATRARRNDGVIPSIIRKTIVELPETLQETFGARAPLLAGGVLQGSGTTANSFSVVDAATIKAARIVVRSLSLILISPSPEIERLRRKIAKSISRFQGRAMPDRHVAHSDPRLLCV
jgi:hypothetical protein